MHAGDLKNPRSHIIKFQVIYCQRSARFSLGGILDRLLK